MEEKHFKNLLAKSLSGTITDTENAMLQNALSESDNYKSIYNELSGYLNQNINYKLKDNAALQLIWNKIEARANKQEAGVFNYDEPIKPEFFKFKYLKIVAVLCICISIGFLSYYYFNLSQSSTYLNVKVGNEKLYKELADGTKIWINRNSELKFNNHFGKTKREIFLEGEAYFEVVKNSKIPLIVHLDKIDIEVKGTSFNVLAYKNQDLLQVALVEGLIHINDKTNSDKLYILKPNQVLTIKENKINTEITSAKHLLQQTSWKFDTLKFNNEKLKDLCLRLEKKYDFNIEIASEQLKEKRFSGVFINESFKEALEALKLSFAFNYTLNGKKAVLKD
jgi:transmembrane sensor